MAKRGLITSGSGSTGSTGGNGVNSYIDLENRPDDVIDTTIVPASTTGGEFTPNNDNSNKASVSISDDGKTITTTRGSDGWGGSGTFSTESIDGDGYVSFKLTRIGKRFMFGLSRASDAGSTTYSTIDFAIYITSSSIQIYENSSNKGGYTSSFVSGGTYKVKRTGNTITYLVNDVVFYTSTTTTTVPLYMDTSFWSTTSRIDEVTMLNTPVTPVPETATYKIDYNNVNLINKPDIHVNVLVSDTDFSTVALALADDAVKNATAGDFVKISGGVHVVIKTSPTVSADLVDIGGDPDLSALATKAELASGLSEKLNLDTYLLSQSLPGVPVTDGIEMAYFPKLPLTELTDDGKVSATSDPKNGRRLVQADVAKQPTFLLDKKNKHYYDIGLEQSLVSEGNISASSLGGATGKTTSFMFVFTPHVSGNNTQFMWGTSSSTKRLSVHLMRDSAGRMVIDHGSNLGGGRYSLTTSTLVAGKVNSLLFIRNDNVAEVWINGVSQGSQTIGNNLPTDATTLPFSIGTMVGNNNYKSALGFNALFFYGRALTVHERTLMIAYSKKEYESIDPVELPAQVSSTEKTARTGTDVRSFSPKDIADMDINGGSSTTLPAEITDTQVTNGTDTDTVLVTPSKLKSMIETHANGLPPSFETLSKNMMAWNVTARTYTDDPSDSSKKVLASVGLVDPSDVSRVLVISNTWNSDGTIQKEVLSFSSRVFPSSIKKTKTYSYTDGRISTITYT